VPEIVCIVETYKVLNKKNKLIPVTDGPKLLWPPTITSLLNPQHSKKSYEVCPEKVVDVKYYRSQRIH